FAMLWKTLAQLAACDCLKIRMLGYHGELSRSMSQRQSATYERQSQTGTPSAPAKCAIAVSEVTTKSRFFKIAAVSTNAADSSRSGPKSTTGNPIVESCSAP